MYPQIDSLFIQPLHHPRSHWTCTSWGLFHSNYSFVLVFCLFVWYWDWTQVLVLGRQAIEPLNELPGPMLTFIRYWCTLSHIWYLRFDHWRKPTVMYQSYILISNHWSFHGNVANIHCLFSKPNYNLQWHWKYTFACCILCNNYVIM